MSIKSVDNISVGVSVQPKFFWNENRLSSINSEAIDIYAKRIKSFRQRQKPLAFCDSESCLQRYRNYRRYYKIEKKFYVVEDYAFNKITLMTAEINPETKRCKDCSSEVIWSRKYSEIPPDASLSRFL